MPRGGNLKKVSNLFEKYKKTLKAPQKHVVEQFCEIVNDVLEISIDSDKVNYSVHNQILSLRVPGPIKSEILIHKKEIITHLRGRLGVQNAPKEII